MVADMNRDLQLNRDTGRMEPPQRSAGVRTSPKPWEPGSKRKKGSFVPAPVPVAARVPARKRLSSKAWLNEIRAMPMAIPAWCRKLMKRGIYPPTLTAEEVNGRHEGELVFVFGNGPSLWEADKYREELKQFVTVGSALSFEFMDTDYLLLQEKTPWVFAQDKILKFPAAIFYPNWKKAGKRKWA